MDFSRHIKPLTGQADWPMWKRKIRDLLDYHEGAIDVIDGKLTKPEPISDTAVESLKKQHKEQCDVYRKANSYAKSMITSTVTDVVYHKIMDKDTALEAWEALKQQFEASSKDQLFRICTEFFAFSWIPGEDVSTHIAKLRSLWNELNSGLQSIQVNKLPDLMLVCKVLHILPSSFETFKSSWMLLSSDDKKSFEELTVQLCMFERNFTKAENSGSKDLQEALAVKPFRQKQKYTSIKKQVGKCNYCHQSGHWVKSCAKWISDGKPPKSNQSKNGAEANVTLFAVHQEALSTEEKTEENSNEWFIDNGASKHVTKNCHYFTDFQKFESPHGIIAASGKPMPAIGKGTLKIVTRVNGNNQFTELKDVWYVPDIRKNLFSVLAAQDRNKNSVFESSSEKCCLKVNNAPILYGTRRVGGGLYRAELKVLTPEVVNVAATTSNSVLQLYHERFGHQDKRHVKNILKKELDIIVFLDQELCEPCVYGKAHRQSFGTRKKASEPGELISADVCGPFDESFQKKRYLVVFKDSFTKFRYGYLMKEKSEVKNMLRKMLSHAKTAGHSIKEFLSDNGGEFDNEDVREILSSEGITQRLTAPYTPEQNGGCEREMRTIVEMARTFKYTNPEVDFPPAIWAELVNSAIYTLNRTGKSSVEDTSPYELWLKKKPRLKHLRVIGSTCYAHIPVQKRRKMDKKATKGYLVGYDGDERYRIWVKEEHRVYLSRDVIFQERPGQCDDHTELSLQDRIEEESNQGKYEEQQEIKEDRIQDEESQEDEARDSDSEEEVEPTPGRQLRDRSLLQKPKRFKDHVMEADTYLSDNDSPETYKEAVDGKDSSNWKKAMDNEMDSLKENQTWELTDLPVGARVIPCKWVYRLKTNPDGSINKYKARLVVKGFSQRQGTEYSETYSPVAKLGTIRTIISIAAEERMHLTQFDVSTAFLYGDLEETIYIKQPEGFEDGTERVCRLKRSLYGLKQSPRCWNKCFGQFLTDLGFKASEADPCLFIRERKGRKLLIALYVDDGLIASTHQQDSEMFIKELKEKFKITVGEVSCFLGLEIECHRDNSITVSQKGYARKILKRFGFDECKPVATPMLKDSRLQNPEDDKISDFPYRQAVGALMYLMLGTRPDLAYSVGFLSRTLENPSSDDIVRVKRVFRYIAGTIDYGITYHVTDTKGILKCYSDSDFGGCTKSGRSTSGYVMIYAGGAITWRSQRQTIVATSTTEAEIVAASEATKEVIWLCRLLQDIGNLKEVPTLQVDNRAAVKLSYNPEYHRRTKHIEIKHFFVREKVLEGRLNVEHVSTERQVSDILTKPLMKSRLLTLCDQMGLS